jgi:hypothetical protein
MSVCKENKKEFTTTLNKDKHAFKMPEQVQSPQEIYRITFTTQFWMRYGG